MVRTKKHPINVIHQAILETVIGYQMPEGMQEVIDAVAFRLDEPRSRVEAVAFRINFPHETI